MYAYSNKNLSISELIAKRAQVKAKEEDKAETSRLKPFHPFKPFPSTDPAVIKLSSAEAFRQAFSKLPGFSALATISTLTPGVRLPTGFKGPVVTNPMTMSFTHSKVEGTAIAEQDNPNLDKKLMMKVRDYCRNHYAGSGTMVGLYLRMSKQLTLKETSSLTQAEFQYIRKVLPFKDNPELSGDGATILGISPEVNQSAAAGAPYFAPGITIEEVIEEVILKAEEYLTILKGSGASGLQNYFISDTDPHMHEMAVMLCPKFDIYERKEYYYKTRPFGVFPGALRILFSCITTNLKPAMVNVFEDHGALSAMGLSWAHGGGNTFYDLLLSRQEPGYYPVSWGDDQLIVVVAQDKSAILTNPDVSGMDMKIDQHKYDLFKAWLLQAYTDVEIDITQISKIRYLRTIIPLERLDNKWLSAIWFFVNYMHKTPLLAYKQYMFIKSRGLMSGINATTWVDTVASASINYHLKSIKIPETFNPSTINVYLDQMHKKAASIGFPFKKMEEQVQVLRKSGGELCTPNVIKGDKFIKLPQNILIGLPFLGQKLAQFTFPGTETDDGEDITIVVPQSDPVAVLAGCALKYPDEKDPIKRFGIVMEGIMGRGFNVVTNVNAYMYLKALWDKHISMGHQPLYTGKSVEVGFQDLPLEEALKSRDYPSLYWFAKVYASEAQKKNLSKIDLVMAEAATPATGKNQLAFEEEELEELSLYQHPKLQASGVRHALELLQDDLEDLPSGIESMTTSSIPPTKVATKQQSITAQSVPSIKAAHDARYKEKFEKIRLIRANYKRISDKVKMVRSSIINDEMADDFDDIDNPELADEIHSYLQDRIEYEILQEDEDYKRWEREFNRQQEREEETYHEEEEEEETEEEKYFDPFSKGDFANVNTRSFSKE
jgi:hypothetical protein